MTNNCCLFCGHSMSADAMDGSQVLVCFECKDYEGKKMQVDEDYCCENYNGVYVCCANNIDGHIYFASNKTKLREFRADANRIAEAVARTKKYKKG